MKFRNVLVNGCQFWIYLIPYVLIRGITQQKSAAVSALNSVTLTLRSAESFWYAWSQFNSWICGSLNLAETILCFLVLFFLFYEVVTHNRLGLFCVKKMLTDIYLPVFKKWLILWPFGWLSLTERSKAA